nr:hypothetical protein [Sphingomonas sp. MA1305]
MIPEPWLAGADGRAYEVAEETVAGLVKDLTTQLSAIAVDFGSRADRLMSQTTLTAQHGQHPPGDIARQLLSQRAARFEHLPADLFHEPAWDMLLALFVAHEERRTMNVKTLVSTAAAPVTTSQRWIDHLHKLKLIDRVIDPIDRRRMEISLSDSGHSAVLAYLRRLGAA